MKYDKLFKYGLKGKDVEGLCYKDEEYRITGTRVIPESKQWFKTKRQYLHQYIVTLHFPKRRKRINLLVDYSNIVIPRGKHKNKIKNKPS